VRFALRSPYVKVFLPFHFIFFAVAGNIAATTSKRVDDGKEGGTKTHCVGDVPFGGLAAGVAGSWLERGSKQAMGISGGV